jgi:rubrerythrin
MDLNSLNAKISRLIHLEIDVAKAADQCLAHIDEPILVEQIGRLKADNERHVLEWSEMLRQLGVQPPRYARDFKGVVMAGATAARAFTGAHGALEALRANARTLDASYDEALRWELPMEMLAQAQGHQADERRHLEMLEQALVQWA